jgi:hypothetical protein
MQRQKTKRTTGALVALALFASISLIASMSAVRPASALSVLSVGRTSSGLVTSDSLTTGNTNLWVFGGSAVAQGTPYSYHEDSSGLYLGVQSNQPGQWSGYYASRGEQAQVFHADLTLPAAILADNQSFNTGLYVQTGGVDVNYVTCGAGVDGGGYYWAVVEATGTPYGATNYNTLYFNWENSQPLTRSCTIVTNGANLLQVYLDGTQVYSSTSMSLGYQSPFSVFLEVQGTDNTVMRFSNYTDYYATTSPTVTVNGAVPGSTAELVSPSGTVLASGSVGQSGTATMDIASFDMPLTANVVVTDGGVTLASTSAPVQVYGGDVYTVGALGTGTTSAQPYTANPWTTNVLNVNLGGLTVDLGSDSGSGSGGGLCILGICL